MINGFMSPLGGMSSCLGWRTRPPGGGEGVVAVNILNNQSWKAHKGWSTSSGVG
jgi:hypothetical protein